MIARTGKDIEVLIDSLPGEESTAELQAAGLRELEQESEVAGEQLRQTVKQGEQLLSSLQVQQHGTLPDCLRLSPNIGISIFNFQAALSNIHTAQLEMQKIAAEEFIEAYTGANTL